MGKVDALLTRLRSQRVYVDTNYLIYFLDRTSHYCNTVAPIFQACDRGDFLGFTGDAAVCEVMAHPYRNKSPSEIARAKSFFTRQGFLTVLRHDADTFDLAAQLRADSNMRLIDALHYATALQAGCRYLLTNDHAFKPGTALDIIDIQSLID